MEGATVEMLGLEIFVLDFGVKIQLVEGKTYLILLEFTFMVHRPHRQSHFSHSILQQQKKLFESLRLQSEVTRKMDCELLSIL